LAVYLVPIIVPGIYIVHAGGMSSDHSLGVFEGDSIISFVTSRLVFRLPEAAQGHPSRVGRNSPASHYSDTVLELNELLSQYTPKLLAHLLNNINWSPFWY